MIIEILKTIYKEYYKEETNSSYEPYTMSILLYLLDKSILNINYEYIASTDGIRKGIINQELINELKKKEGKTNIFNNLELSYEIISIIDYIKTKKPKNISLEAWIKEIEKVAYYHIINIKDIDLHINNEAIKLFSNLVNQRYKNDIEYSIFINYNTLYTVLIYINYSKLSGNNDNFNNNPRDSYIKKQIEDLINTIYGYRENKKKEIKYKVISDNGNEGIFISYDMYIKIMEYVNESKDYNNSKCL